MWVTWYHVFHYSGTVRLALDRVATHLPAALLLLRDVAAVAETMCLPSRSLATAVSLDQLFRPSGIISQYHYTGAYGYTVLLPHPVMPDFPFVEAHEDTWWNGGIAPPFWTPYAFMLCCLAKQSQGQVYLYMDNLLVYVLKEILNININEVAMDETSHTKRLRAYRIIIRNPNTYNTYIRISKIFIISITSIYC
jgi:hypothetical protein